MAGTATAGHLLRIYSIRLDTGRYTMAPAVRSAIERLVYELGTLSPAELIEVDTAADHEPLARFVRLTTGEVIGELELPSNLQLGN